MKPVNLNFIAKVDDIFRKVARTTKKKKYSYIYLPKDWADSVVVVIRTGSKEKKKELKSEDEEYVKDLDNEDEEIIHVDEDADLDEADLEEIDEETEETDDALEIEKPLESYDESEEEGIEQPKDVINKVSEQLSPTITAKAKEPILNQESKVEEKIEEDIPLENNSESEEEIEKEEEIVVPTEIPKKEEIKSENKYDIKKDNEEILEMLGI
jgi:hypothetical protein